MSRFAFALVCLMISGCSSKGQITLIREGVTINSTITGNWSGDAIPKSSKTNLIYRNNSITSVNTEGYLFSLGDETPGSTNNNLDGAQILGNKFSWKGITGTAVITHGLFTGYNKDLVVKYNYLENTPYGIIFKSGTDDGVNMNFASGGCAYNICKNGKFAVRLKGMNGVKIYNNTFYSGDGAGLYLVLITSNSDRQVPAPSLGTSICNNIFYSTTKIPMIAIEQASLANFYCDYNIYWCSAGEPSFMIQGKTYSFTQWQGMGYDTHSKIIDPNFKNTTEFVPAARLDYAKDLGSEWQTGLSTSANWTVGISPSTTNQNGAWQVGAVLYKSTNSVSDVSITSDSGITSINTKNGTLQLSAQITPADAANKSVTWSITTGNNLATINSTGLLTAIGTGTVTVRATANDGSNVYGEINVSISIPTLVDNINTKAYFKLYPIPTTGPLFVDISEQLANGTLIEIMDAAGSLLDKLHTFNSQVKLELSRYQGSIFLIKVKNEKLTEVTKVIVCRKR